MEEVEGSGRRQENLQFPVFFYIVKRDDGAEKDMREVGKVLALCMTE